MKYYKHLLFITISLLSLSTFAQTSKKTLNYQAVILDPKAIDIPGASITGQPLNKGNVCLRFSLLNAQGGLDYEETQQVTTDEYGLVNVAIGAGAQAQASNSTSIYKSFDSVLWNSNVKSLKVSVSYDGCNSFKQVSSQALNYTPYALYAEAVDYKNVREAPTKLSQFSNDAGFLIPKDLDPLKADIKSNTSQLATANQTIADNKKSSDATFLVVNQSITSLDTQVAANTTAIKETSNTIGTINSKLNDQQNQIVDNRNQITTTSNSLNTQIGGLQGQLNTTNSTVSNLTGTAEIVSNKSTETNLGGANPSDQLYPSQKAAKAYVDQVISQIATSGVPDATTLAAGKLQLSGDLGGTATSPTVPALSGKENSSNKSTSVQTDGGNDTKYPSVKAVKDYVDQATMGTALQATVDGKADKASPTFTGTPVLPTGTTGITQSATDNSTKLATTAFVQAATTGIALQAAVDAKADKNSPTFTGTPILPTGTTGATQLSGDNSTKLATTAYVDAQVSAGAADASSSIKGIIQLTGALGGTASSPTVPGLALKANTSDVTTSLATKEDASNKSNSALGTSTTLFPTQNAVKTYVDGQISSATIVDADASTKGKLQLAGDLAGSALSPSVVKLRGTPINSIAPTTAGHVLTYDVNGSATWAAPANSANTISGVVPVANGGTGLSSVTNGGAVYASSSSALTTGTLPLTAGGTGVTSQQAAINILTGTQSTGKYLRSDGTDASLSTIQAADVPTLNQNTTGTAATVSGIVAVTNGGTGASTLTGYLKGSGTSVMTASAGIPVDDLTGTLPITAGGTGASTANSALNALVPDQTSNTGKYLTTNGTNTSWSGVTATSYSGILPLLNGGTGQTTIAGIQSILGLAGTKVAIGADAGKTNQAEGASAFGGQAGQTSQGAYSVALGYVAGQLNQGTLSVAVGNNAAQSGQGSQSVAIGYVAGQTNQGANSVAIGTNSHTAANAVAIGGYAISSYANSTAIGYKAATSAANTIQLGGDGVVTGSTAITNVKTTGTLTAGTVTYPNAHNATAGQVLSINSTGTATWATPASSGGTHTIGESYGGGIVFYVWDGGAHGLIGANTELNNGQAMSWGGGSNSYVGTTSFYGVLGGKLNTQRILNVIPVPTYGNGDPGTGPKSAAFWAATYLSSAVVVSGVTTTPQFSDWYLPNAYELTLFAAQSAYFPNCNFATHIHWSSSERSDYAYLAYALGANSSTNTYQDAKSSTNYVVAIRSF
jgi:hypothetical protein